MLLQKPPVSTCWFFCPELSFSGGLSWLHSFHLHSSANNEREIWLDHVMLDPGNFAKHPNMKQQIIKTFRKRWTLGLKRFKRYPAWLNRWSLAGYTSWFRLRRDLWPNQIQWQTLQIPQDWWFSVPRCPSFSSLISKQPRLVLLFNWQDLGTGKWNLKLIPLSKTKSNQLSTARSTPLPTLPELWASRLPALWSQGEVARNLATWRCCLCNFHLPGSLRVLSCQVVPSYRLCTTCEFVELESFWF